MSMKYNHGIVKPHNFLSICSNIPSVQHKEFTSLVKLPLEDVIKWESQWFILMDETKTSLDWGCNLGCEENLFVLFNHQGHFWSFINVKLVISSEMTSLFWTIFCFWMTKQEHL